MALCGPPGSLDRIHARNDWLHREIAHAVRSRRNIVPILLPGFQFPARADLPEDIQVLRDYDAIEYSHRYFPAMVEKLAERLG
jgi:hypothetical protein